MSLHESRWAATYSLMHEASLTATGHLEFGLLCSFVIPTSRPRPLSSSPSPLGKEPRDLSSNPSSDLDCVIWGKAFLFSGLHSPHLNNGEI